MKPITFQRLSILGLVLAAASTITAVVLPKNDFKKVNNGILVLTSDGVAITCQLQSGANACTATAQLPSACPRGIGGIGTRTSTFNAMGQNDSSSISTEDCSQSVKSITEDVNNIVVNNIHTSVAQP